ncbi:HhH-GPD family protein [Halococcoides cellulosivorans]|uniref:Adenine DNA glycosylase n=1 Tax=Halococcoides cellulosivorans TaxID=1679096 RepID=A0A2R4X211_9EURY|nr:A/G-specific adenine glycosylase [Halococcoides cellulosivorans]AWB27836.1 A/G-specific adenine glycosylase [Halococcoides cellulosivorans]
MSSVAWPTDPDHLREALLAWYDDGHREFPWRDDADPWAILVSEVMSQQTQLDRIVEPYREFVDRWPTPGALAAADRSAVVAFWTDHSLGYNNRARYLHEAAAMVVEEFDGSLPADRDSLQTLQGVGPYTATAVAAFAFDRPVAVVDTNVERVLYRLLEGVREHDDPPYDALIEELLAPDRPAAFNNAIMELGGVACTPTPACDDAACPFRSHCHAYRTGDFTAPDVPTQPAFDGSRRQFRGRVLRTLADGPRPVDAVGHAVRVDYDPAGDPGREWLDGLLDDLERDGLIERRESDGERVVALRSSDSPAETRDATAETRDATADGPD